MAIKDYMAEFDEPDKDYEAVVKETEDGGLSISYEDNKNYVFPKDE